MSMRSPKKKSRIQSFWPVLGFLLAVMVGIMAWFISPTIDNALRQSLPNFREMPPDNLRILTTVIMFVVFVLLASLIVAASAPKKKDMVNEPKLAKERVEMLKEKKLTKLRRQQMNRMNKG